MPTEKQSNTAIFLCQLLSNLYQAIQVFRYDYKLKTLYIQAGATDEIALITKENGGEDFVLMTQNLDQMTNAELRRYISEHRNDEEAFRAALEALISRRDPNASYQPYPLGLADPKVEVEALLMKKLNQVE